MLKNIDKLNIHSIKSFLEQYVYDCLYIYIDIVKYGLDNPNIKLWFTEKENSYNGVYMKYFDSIQMFAIDAENDKHCIYQLINEINPKTISGSENTIRMIENTTKDNYIAHYGIIVKETKYKVMKYFDRVELAKVDDCYDIARLLCQDEEFGTNYNVDNLCLQLINRINTKMGRNYVIRENGKIVAHVATFAETDKIAIESGLIVSPEFKNTFYGLVMHEFIKMAMIKENKDIYAFRIKEEMIKYKKSPGTIECATYGKLTRKE